MSPKRGDRASPPPVGDEFDLRFGNGEAAAGWEELARQAPGNLRRAFDVIRSAPRGRENPDRQHQLKGKLGTAPFKGQSLERWQYEVTGGGRIWYLVEDGSRTVWIVYAGTGHPGATG